MEEKNEVTDTESLEIVNSYLKQLYGNNTTELTDLTDLTNNKTNTHTEINESGRIKAEFDVDSDELVGLSIPTELAQESSVPANIIFDLKAKLELENSINIQLTENIKKEKELLQITQDKILQELNLLETIKKRLVEEEKLNNILLKNSTIKQNTNTNTNNDTNHVSIPVLLSEPDNMQSVIINNNIYKSENKIKTHETETKVTKANPIYFRNIKKY
jgi:hypothetical protein